MQRSHQTNKCEYHVGKDTSAAHTTPLNAPPPGQNGVNGRHTVLRCLDIHEIHRFHKTGCRQKKSRVRHASRRWNDLTGSAVYRRVSNRGVQQFELDASDRFLAQWTFACTPLKALHYRRSNAIQQSLVHIRCNGIVHENIPPVVVGAERPHRPRCQNVPLVFFPKELCDRMFALGDLHCNQCEGEQIAVRQELTAIERDPPPL